MTFKELTMTGPGNYDIGIVVSPPPHMRGQRDTSDGYDERTLLARLTGGTLTGSSDKGMLEVNLMAPSGIEDDDGDRIILASFEFHSFQLESAYNGFLYFKGYLSAVEAHSQEVYDSIKRLRKIEEFEKIPTLTSSDGRLKYLPRALPEAQQFIGWQALVTVRPVPAMYPAG